jgi:regulator of protease activity HflC (stomatin/prohibitin superfamily)
MFLSIRIRQHERGLLFRYGDFVGVIRPGKHWLWSRLINPLRAEVQVVNTLNSRFEHPMLDVLLQHEDFVGALAIVENSDTQRAIVWKDGRVLCVLGPGRFAFWTTPAKVRIEQFDIESFRFQHRNVQAILQAADAARWLDGVKVDAGEVVLLFRDGVFSERLGEGLHVFWKGTGHVTWKTISLCEQMLDVAGQEIITADKVSLRVNLVVTYLVSDPVKSVTLSADAGQALYRDAQLALRAVIGTRQLDDLLADKESVGNELRQMIVARAGELGLTVRNVGLRDIILPGDMKLLLNQVIAATKEAEANVIRRREETAAARSQANTARLLAENPPLARLKELEALQQILAGAKATFVVGNGDLVKQVTGLLASQPSQ